jgi:DNA-binding GntR family transcriptional regulator
MNVTTQIKDRRTSADIVFDHLYGQIVSLNLLPGKKISEAEIANLFDISRQPVRDAFSRLESMNLLLIRPQKATEVKRFSIREINKSRFVRAAVEAEVLRRASIRCNDTGALLLDECLQKQSKIVAAGDFQAFAALDYEFHKTLCEIAGVDFAFEVISTEKSNVDRLCLLGLAKGDRMPELLDDHKKIAQHVIDHEPELAVKAGMSHLAGLDETIESISTRHADYFDP